MVIIIILIYLLIKFRRKEEKISRASSFKCLDGHVVKSKGELIIDNFLYLNGIEHDYEKTIMVRGNPIKYDWYLPKYKTYIEYWGFFGRTYLQRKEEKIKLYHKGKLKLVSIEDIMFKDIYSNLSKELKEFIQSKESESRKIHCPNCGMELDERF